MWMVLLSLALADELPALVRVDVPDYPGALATSTRGSLLDRPPTDGTPWRLESLAELDQDAEGTGPVVGWEALEAMNVPAWHDAGYDGSGVKIALFDVQWYGAELDGAELGDYTTHDCFIHASCAQPIDTLRPTFSFETGSHGVACAELIRDIAPGAELYLVRVSGLTTLENAVSWAIREDIDLISMSLSFFNESFYDGTGDINDLMDQLAAAGVLMVTSAGNYADQHYRGDFLDADGDRYHDFPSGPLGLPIELPRGRSQLYLLWDQFAYCGRTDLDAFVYSEAGAMVGFSAETQQPEDGCFPGERISAYAEESGVYYLRLRLAGGVAETRFDVQVRSGSVLDPVVEGSITDPGTHPSVLTVGAVRATSYLTAPVEGFSSQGPTNGGLPKPDISGPNGVSTTVYGPTGFFGTSASTPAVTAALALVLQREPELTPAEAAARLQAWAVRPEARATWEGPDTAEGVGRARLPDLAWLDSGCRSRRAGVVLLPLLLAGGVRSRRRSR